MKSYLKPILYAGLAMNTVHDFCWYRLERLALYILAHSHCISGAYRLKRAKMEVHSMAVRRLA